MGSNPATPTIFLLEFKGFILNGAAVSSAPKEERKGVKSPAGDAKVPQVFLWRSGCGALKIFWRLAAVFALLAVALASPAEAKAHWPGWARMAFREGHPCPSTGATWGACPGFVIDHSEPICAGGGRRADQHAMAGAARVAGQGPAAARGLPRDEILT